MTELSIVAKRFWVATTLAGSIASASACGPVHRTDGGMGLLHESAAAPDFHAPDQEGHTRSLGEFRGRAVVLYFYPRDGTPGCTREACAFRDAWQRLSATGAQVVGVSSNSVRSHADFAREHHLPFPLLADDGRIARSYGVGTFLGMESRVTFLIAPDGHVARVYPDVDPGVHANEVIQALQSMSAPLPASPSPPASAAVVAQPST